MFGKLPSVIENHVFSYLIYQQDKNISRYFRNIFESVSKKYSFFKEKRLLTDRVNMVIEELSDPIHHIGQMVTTNM